MDKFIFINPFSGKQIKENGPMYKLLINNGNLPLKMSEKKFINNKLKNAQGTIKKTMEILGEKNENSDNKSVKDIIKNLIKAKNIMQERGIISKDNSNSLNKPTPYKNKIDKLFNTNGFKTVKCKKNGNCFFQALSIALNVSINELRNIVSKNITHEQFSFWKEIWESTESEEFDFMDNINSIYSLREIILTNDFWGEEVSINILQKHFNVGLIIIDSVTNDVVTKFKFSNTNKYIILNFKGVHYDLVKYDNAVLFDKLTLPAGVIGKLIE